MRLFALLLAASPLGLLAIRDETDGVGRAAATAAAPDRVGAAAASTTAAAASQGCSAVVLGCNEVSEEVKTTINKACAVVEECGEIEHELEKRAEVRAAFPHFNRAWCQGQLDSMVSNLCGQEKTPIAASILDKLVDVTNIVKAGIQSFGDGNINPATCDLSDADAGNNCAQCADAAHRGGGDRRYRITSYACAWNQVEGQCEADLRKDMSSALECPVPNDIHTTALLNVTAPRRFAFLVSYNYLHHSPENHLRGTVKDLENVVTELLRRQFDPGHIFIHTDYIDPQNVYPPFNRLIHETQISLSRGFATDFWSAFDGALRAMNLQSADYLFVHIAGHGITKEDGQHDDELDELDGLDEALVSPRTEMIYDDDFYKRLIFFPAGVDVTVIADICHSEGLSDLPFNYVDAERKWCLDWLQPKTLPQARILFISGSQNHEESGESSTGGGKLTSYMLEQWNSKQSLNEAMKDMRYIFSGGVYFHMLQFLDQRPNVCAFPTFSDNQESFTAWEKVRALSVNRFHGGKKVRGAVMRGPQVCDHGGVAASGDSHERRSSLVNQAKRQFEEQEQLSDATQDAQFSQGWIGVAAPAAQPNYAPTQPQAQAATGGCQPGLRVCYYSNSNRRKLNAVILPNQIAVPHGFCNLDIKPQAPMNLISRTDAYGRC